MLRNVLLAAAMLATLVLPSLGQEVRECPPGVALAGPFGFVSDNSLPQFRWTAEPEGTASREIVLVSVDQQSKQVIVKAGAFKTRFDVPDGAFSWFVIFRGAAGRVICRSVVAAIVVGADVRKILEEAPASGGAANAVAAIILAPPVVLYTNASGQYVIVLAGSPYTGPYTELINADDFDGGSYALGSATGLEIHGNDNANSIAGSALIDLIFAYGQVDTVNSGGGGDTVHGGDGGDIINGGDGNDALSGEGGNDTIHGDNGGDAIDGGAGNDQLFADSNTTGGAVLDRLTGGSGQDFAGAPAGNNVRIFTQDGEVDQYCFSVGIASVDGIDQDVTGSGAC